MPREVRAVKVHSSPREEVVAQEAYWDTRFCSFQEAAYVPVEFLGLFPGNDGRLHELLPMQRLASPQ